MDLLRAQRLMHASLRQLREEITGLQPYFSSTFLLFEGAVTLCIALCREPTSPHVQVWRDEVKAAMELLEGIRETDKGDITQQALLALGMLRETDAKTSLGVVTPAPGLGLGVGTGIGVGVGGNVIGRASSDPPSGASSASGVSIGTGEWMQGLGLGFGMPGDTTGQGQFTNQFNMQYVPANAGNNASAAPLDWMSEGLGSSLSSYELLHSLGLH
jgi:hypothetical protein